MTRLITLSLIIIIFSFTQSVFAKENLCKLAEPMVNQTQNTARKYFENNFKNRSYNGEGSIRDVYSKYRDSDIKIEINCGNNVLISFKSQTSIDQFEIGQIVRFSGSCRSMKKLRYTNTGKRYVRITLWNGSSVHKH